MPAAAFATTPTPQVSYKGVPGNVYSETDNCSTGNPIGDKYAHVSGPATPRLGAGSLKISQANSDTYFEIDFRTTQPALSTLSNFDADFYVPSTGGVTPMLIIQAREGSGASETDYVLYVQASQKDAWATLDATTATLQGFSVTNPSSATPTFAPIPATTLTAFTTAHPSAVLDTLTVDTATDCTKAGTYYLDALHYNVNGTESLTDFEAPLPTALVNGSHPATVLTGQSVSLSATLTHSGTAFAGEPVQLWARRTGASAYSVVKTATTDANGKVSAVVAPTATTAYQWRYAAAGNDYAPVNASSSVVTTRQRVAISSRPTTVSYRGYATVKGRLTPTKAGVTVRLVRIVSGRQVVVASARTLTGGYFTIKAPMTVRGVATYAVTAVAYTGEAAGQSATFRITTR